MEPDPGLRAIAIDYIVINMIGPQPPWWRVFARRRWRRMYEKEFHELIGDRKTMKKQKPKSKFTARTAKIAVLKRAAAELHSHIANGSEWLVGGAGGLEEELSPTDQKRMVKALENLVEDMEKRAARLEKSA